MLHIRLIIFALVFVVVANATSSGSNNTCATGLSLVACDVESSRCMVPCNTDELWVNACEEKATCFQCRQKTWCNGLTYNDCPISMGSPTGSTEPGNCTCHRGHIQTASICTVCPEGSWCDLDGQHSCPTGMTSNLASVTQEDCYCLDTYNGTVNCADRANTTHHRCNAGYAFTGVQVDSNTGVEFDFCQDCASNFYCDGTSHFDCPTQDMGVQYTYGKQTYADCFCPYGYTTLYGQGPCVPCSNRTGLNISKLQWTSGVNCEELEMSKVTFTTTLNVPLAEFNSKREEYVTGVAQALWVPLASVVIGQVSETTSVRRLLSTTITVVNTVTIPTDDAQVVSTAVTSNNLAVALTSRSMAVATVSTATVSPVSPVSTVLVQIVTDTADTPQPQSDTLGLYIVLISCGAFFLLLCGVVAWCLYTRHYTHAYTPSSIENIDPLPDYVKQSQPQAPTQGLHTTYAFA